MHPPRVAGLVVRAAVPEPHREFVLGDLDERFEIDVRRRGRFAASRRYWMQAFGMIWHGRSLNRRRVVSGSTGSGGRFDMGSFWRDVRLGLRTAWHSPGYSAIAIVTLALAIGANTLLFSIANPLIIRGLPVKDPADARVDLGRQSRVGRHPRSRVHSGLPRVARGHEDVRRARRARQSRRDADRARRRAARADRARDREPLRHLGCSGPPSAACSSPAKTRPVRQSSACSATRYWQKTLSRPRRRDSAGRCRSTARR